MTMLLTFQLHVVEGFRDAREELVVVAMESEQLAEEGPLEEEAPLEIDDVPGGRPAPGAESAQGDERTARIETGSDRRGSGATNTLAPQPAEPAEACDPATERERDVAVVTVRDVLDAGSPRLDISVHAVAGLPGVTALGVEGYESRDARQPHLSFGARVAGAPQGARWAMEVGISGEWPLAPTVHVEPKSDAVLELGGPWLRMDVGLRAHFGTRWRPTLHAGIGLQAHFRNVDAFRPDPLEPDRKFLDYSRQDMTFGGAFVFGMGFEHRRGDMLLGIDLQVRQGVPGEYRSVGMLLSWGYFWDKENDFMKPGLLCVLLLSGCSYFLGEANYRVYELSWTCLSPEGCERADQVPLFDRAESVIDSDRVDFLSTRDAGFFERAELIESDELPAGCSWMYSLTLFGHELEPSRFCRTSNGFELEVSIPNRDPTTYSLWLAAARHIGP
jgi:hypothetical protein